MEGQRPRIVLLVENAAREKGHSVYMIEPPLDLSDEMIDSEGYMSKRVSPLLFFPDRNENHILRFCTSVNLGSQIYFLGGLCCKDSLEPHVARTIACRVQVFDTHRPEDGLRSVAPMTSPKECPCLFVADDMIYALGYSPDTAYFERYSPHSNCWQPLPDPPLPPTQGENFVDCATLVGRLVFISSLAVVFNLESETWEDPVPLRTMIIRCFPHSSLFVPDTASLYHLTGPGSWKQGTEFIPRGSYTNPLQVLKRGPLENGRDNVSIFLESVSRKEHVMAEGLDLGEDIFFADSAFRPWRELFHMGGRCFCYILTAQLAARQLSVGDEPNSRAVWIRFFEEITLHTNSCSGDDCNCTETKFRNLATFSYKIVTDFDNFSFFIRCSVLGTVPDAWIKSPQKFKQEWKPKQILTRDDDLAKNPLSVFEENKRLLDELARKDELLKTYERMLACHDRGLGLLKDRPIHLAKDTSRSSNSPRQGVGTETTNFK